MAMTRWALTAPYLHTFWVRWGGGEGERGRERYRLKYGNDTVGTDGTIPAHLLGKVGERGERGREVGEGEGEIQTEVWQ